jgi:hypothetical protein
MYMLTIFCLILDSLIYNIMLDVNVLDSNTCYRSSILLDYYHNITLVVLYVVYHF